MPGRRTLSSGGSAPRLPSRENRGEPDARPRQDQQGVHIESATSGFCRQSERVSVAINICLPATYDVQLALLTPGRGSGTKLGRPHPLA
jgi:hypothetical protein